MSLNILADANIPGIAEACAPLGTVRLYGKDDGPQLRTLLATADVLLCRSTLRVDAELLAGTPVAFVATATAGIEHVDVAWLRERGIGFASAAGSNALSVAEYVFTALYVLACRQGRKLHETRIGIVGVGHVGTWVAHLAEKTGMSVILNDPPLEAARGGAQYRPLHEALAADIVTLHVPLTTEGPYATQGMIGDAAFEAMNPKAVFINTARGAVVDTEALLRARAGGRFSGLVFDVYPDEPYADPRLVRAADIATPHIAGHSLDGKLLGTQMVYEALCRFASVQPAWNYLDTLPPASALGRRATRGGPPVCEIAEALTGCFDIGADDRALRSMSALPKDQARAAFSAYRASYPARREFHSCFIDFTAYSREAARVLAALAQRG